MKKFFALILALLMVLSLVACGQEAAPADEGGEEVEEEATGLKICFISSSGSDDGNFTQNCYEGAKAFVDAHPDCTLADIKQPDMEKLIPNVDELVADYDVFVLPGFNFAAIGDIAEANPDKYFIVVDSTITSAAGDPMTLDNVFTMTFAEHQSAFPVGVAAALNSASGKVAVVNGIAFPSNVNYQYGFMAGVQYANKVLGTSVECVEIDSYAGTDVLGNAVGGNYIGDFADEATGKVVGKALIDQGVDVLFAAAGASGNGVMAAAKEAGVLFIGCDVDQSKDCPDICLTSTLKIMDANVQLQLEKIYDGSFVGEDGYLDCNNNGVGYVSESGHCLLDADMIAKIDEAFALVQSGEIVLPADATVNEYTPADYPGK